MGEDLNSPVMNRECCGVEYVSFTDHVTDVSTYRTEHFNGFQ